MKTIIAGSRIIKDYFIVNQAIKESGFKITQVVSGKAPGVGRLGEKWAKKHGIPIKEFPADWERFGRGAGFRRNQEMADYADALIVVTAGTKGTGDMIERARERKLKIFIYTLGSFCVETEEEPVKIEEDEDSEVLE